MAAVETLTMWDVVAPHGFLAALPKLRSLDLRGGTGTDLKLLDGCATLQRLAVNQVRGLSDLSAVAELSSLRCLDLYGLPRVTAAPSLGRLVKLQRIDIGSMKGLESIEPFLRAPALAELRIVRAVTITATDLELMADHPTLAAFDWFWEDVPVRVARPVIDRMAHLARPTARSSADWLVANS